MRGASTSRRYICQFVSFLETVGVTEGTDVASGVVHGCVQEGVVGDGSLDANWGDVPGENGMGVPGLSEVLGEVPAGAVPGKVSGFGWRFLLESLVLNLILDSGGWAQTSCL